MSQLKVPAALMRGGTSKGLFFLSKELPDDPALRDRVLLRSFGSPDPYARQIDGLGGGTSVTSKAAIISRSTRPDCDVDYLFAQVAIEKALVDFSANCGNLSAAVGPFAIEERLIESVTEQTAVRIWQVNTSKRIIAHCPTEDGSPRTDGDYLIDGIAFPGAEIVLDFIDPGGSQCAELFPTGQPIDKLDVPGVGRIDVTLVDAGNPVAIVRAADLKLAGAELPSEVDSDKAVLQALESIRAHAAVRMGLGSDPLEVTRTQPANPKVAFVSEPLGYRSSRGTALEASAMDLNARIMSMGRLHGAFAVTGAIAVATAAAVPGTLAHSVRRPPRPDTVIRIGHPSGVFPVGIEVAEEDGRWVVSKAVVRRTARRLMEGYLRIPAADVPGWR